MDDKSRDQLLALRLEQMHEGATEAIRAEVEWLKKHNFEVWVCNENGEIVNAASDERDEPQPARPE